MCFLVSCKKNDPLANFHFKLVIYHCNADMTSIRTTTLEARIQGLSLFSLNPTHHELIFVLLCVSIVSFPWCILCLIICHSFHNFIQWESVKVMKRMKTDQQPQKLLYQDQKIKEGHWIKVRLISNICLWCCWPCLFLWLSSRGNFYPMDT